MIKNKIIDVLKIIKKAIPCDTNRWINKGKKMKARKINPYSLVKKIDKKTKVYIIGLNFDPVTPISMSKFYFEKLQKNNIENKLEIVLNPKHESGFLLSDPSLLKFSKRVLN